MSELDIVYYESMIGLIQENQKINEMIMAPKFALLTESQEDILVCEGKVIDFIFTSIKKIFDKVVEFFGKIMKIFSRKDVFIADKKLLSAFTEKLKRMTSEDASNFIMKDIDVSDSIEDAVTVIYKDFVSANEYLYRVVNGVRSILYDEPLKIDIESEYEKIQKDIETFSKRLEENSDTKKMSKIDITNDNLYDVFVDYKNFYAEMADTKSNMKNSQNSMKEYRNMIDTVIKHDIVENVDSNILQKLRDAIYLITGYMMNCNKVLLNLKVEQFKNDEFILRKFITMPLINNESAIYFDIISESITYTEYELQGES